MPNAELVRATQPALVCVLLAALAGGFAQVLGQGERGFSYNQLAYLVDGQPSLADDNVRFMDNSDDDLVALPEGGGERLLRNEVYLLEDKDYPRSLFEDYPRRVGQVSGITTLANNDVVIFHRSQRHWDSNTFSGSANNNTQLPSIQVSRQGDLLTNDTIMIINGEDGSSMRSFGANLFYMPHSVAADGEGNLWLSDVARHQVMRLPAEAWQQQQTTNTKRTIWPDIILGEAFVPGEDEAHFCQPAELAVSSNGRLLYVADGYCNSRVVVYTGAGQLLATFGQEQNMSVVHSLTLIEERNLLCVADRENGRILCFHAGLNSSLDSLGRLEVEVKYPLGRVFALTALSQDHLLVSSQEANSNRYDLAILNPFTSELKLVWTSSDLLEPHSLAVTRDRQAAYAADISRDAYKKVFKFNIIQRMD